MDEELREALLYIERTAHRLLEMEHPKPRRAVYLLRHNLDIVEALYPRNGYP